jgi:hypothetical protein
MTHTKDEAFLEWYKNAHWGNEDFKEGCNRSWNAAIKQALAAPVQPVDATQVSKVWWDGEKLMAKPIPLEDFYQPAPVPEDRDWSLLEATQESLREHMAEIKRLKEAHPAPEKGQP